MEAHKVLSSTQRMWPHFWQQGLEADLRCPNALPQSYLGRNLQYLGLVSGFNASVTPQSRESAPWSQASQNRCK